MYKFVLPLIALSLIGCGQESKIVNIKAKGSLESKHPLACINISELNNTYTPADMFVGIEQCIKNEEYDNAVNLLFVASSYGKFDSLRVKDRTAHQAISMLKLETMQKLDKNKIEAFRHEFTLKAKDPALNIANCNVLMSLGAPSYSPEYMMKHGMSNFTGKGGGLIDDFEPSEAWSTVIKDFAKCSV
jgi:hypothetical protein